MGDTNEESIGFRSGKCRRCGFPIASHPACHSQTSCPGPVDALAQYSALDRPDLERHVHLLGFSGVPAQTRSGFWQLRLLGNIGIWLCAHLPGLSHYSDPPNWIYNHLSLGPGMLSEALRLHWLFAYLFMLNGVLYLVGLALGGGYRALLPRLTDLRDSLLMMRYYAGLFFAKVARRVWPHPEVTTKYNALQRLSYFAMPVAGTFSVLTGWAIHKPMQLSWLAALFGGYDAARVWHFWLIALFLLFVVPHVILVFADGWDTLRSMVTGWSKRTRGTSHGK
jgi:thiosulfate reductase cytochrome b subunit